MFAVLADDVRLAWCDGDAVFLKAGDYICVPRRHAVALADAINGKPIAETGAVLTELREQGLLAWRDERLPPRAAVIVAASDLGDVARREPAGLRDYAHLLIAALYVPLQLIRRRPEAWLRYLPPQALTPRGTPEQLARRFLRLRGLIPASGRCLPASLLLINFLRLGGIAADLVIGVRTHPFEAHCWVETGGKVLNDEICYCRSFSPIFVWRGAARMDPDPAA
ncbi:lasso peptide biosynthesis B2 protein [Sphingosinicella microcystinivorans]|uniref:Transglutaminase superfamily protein n=1 Tax=Sphingosinicella microcystinivorans TaxID=335406 RepID=A0AAD1FZ55_SPHMI|nr:lasso peptide biosynthesis B2 protein [Sphingosinicella microcystinivorans]RKS88651.1 transglutaminase superfamily protein [Sphingosinicella microcystinivorans]BBE32398.1 hypothetical protein SmB9_00560 [Sphingosinicella microcystinivorans]